MMPQKRLDAFWQHPSILFRCIRQRREPTTKSKAMMILSGKACMLGTALAALLLLAAVSVDAESAELGSSSSGSDAKPRRKKKNTNLFDAEGKGKGKGKEKRKGKKKRRSKGKGKGGSSLAKPPTPPADGCPCFTAADIDDYWYMYKSHYKGEDPCDAVDYEDGRKEWYIVFKGNEDAEEGFEFYVEDDDDLGVCEVSKYFDPSVGQAEVDRSFAGMDFENMDMVAHCIDEIKHSSMYQMCIEPFDEKGVGYGAAYSGVNVSF